MKKIWLPQVLMTIILTGAILDALEVVRLAYDYFKLLKIICCGVAVYLVWKAYSQGNSTWLWVFVVVAFIYNPIMPFRLYQGTWAVINSVTIVIALSSIFKMRKAPDY